MTRVIVLVNLMIMTVTLMLGDDDIGGGGTTIM